MMQKKSCRFSHKANVRLNKAFACKITDLPWEIKDFMGGVLPVIAIHFGFVDFLVETFV